MTRTRLTLATPAGRTVERLTVPTPTAARTYRYFSERGYSVETVELDVWALIGVRS